MADQTYNGWPNYETWLAYTWITNEEGSYTYWLERSREMYAEAEPRNGLTKLETATTDLAHVFKVGFEQNAPDGEGFYADLLTAALSSVQWYSVARNLLEDAEDEAAL